MSARTTSPAKVLPPAGHSPAHGALPLIGLTGILFAAALALFALAPAWGPNHLPLYELHLGLAIVAANGSTVSWFYGSDEAEAPPAQSRPRPATAQELGRPAPEVRSIGPGPDRAASQPRAVARAKPWDEDPLPPAVAHGPRPVLTTPDDPGEIGRALEEIAEIQRQLVTRSRTDGPAPESPARS